MNGERAGDFNKLLIKMLMMIFTDLLLSSRCCLLVVVYFLLLASFRTRLQKRLAGMLVVLGQLQAEVDEKTVAVKVAKERVSE